MMIKMIFNNFDFHNLHRHIFVFFCFFFSFGYCVCAFFLLLDALGHFLAIIVLFRRIYGSLFALFIGFGSGLGLKCLCSEYLGYHIGVIRLLLLRIFARIFFIRSCRGCSLFFFFLVLFLFIFFVIFFIVFFVVVVDFFFLFLFICLFVCLLFFLFFLIKFNYMLILLIFLLFYFYFFLKH